MAASYFSEKLAVKTKYQETFSFLLHAFFGWAFFAAYALYDWIRWDFDVSLADQFLNLLSLAGVFCAITFYVSDAVLRLRK
ncbi:hypothetical protein CR205_11475 [Alteribacter lacisalsi]|uniref:Uncharacterized protein n=1 Tax=Alteribacter lacisalsi TaxID=2045244 RepID=A0A2W0H3D0_9BACI|nr:hypothetical protein [Alteribacter lacisalsi]PYZ96343.1 hypothetical protein CR205_11475 [Alteribacter lacisalsi]